VDLSILRSSRRAGVVRGVVARGARLLVGVEGTMIDFIFLDTPRATLPRRTWAGELQVQDWPNLRAVYRDATGRQTTFAITMGPPNRPTTRVGDCCVTKEASNG
jgi:hypothetical protein